MNDRTIKAYKSSNKFYDDVLTNKSFLSKLYIRFFWNVNDNLIAEKVLSGIPDDFSDKSAIG